MGSWFKGSQTLLTIAVPLTSDPGCLMCTCRTCLSIHSTESLNSWNPFREGTKCYFGKYVIVATLIFSFLFWLFCMWCLYMCCTYMWVCMCTGVCAAGFEGASSQLQVSSSITLHLNFQTGFLTEHRAHQLDRPTGKCASWNPCLHFPRTSGLHTQYTWPKFT